MYKVEKKDNNDSSKKKKTYPHNPSTANFI